MSYQHILSSLTEREAITDTVYRVVMAFDDNDLSLLESAFSGEDSIVDFHGTVMPISVMKANIFDRVAALDTTHSISNIRVELKDGANTASLTAVALAQHCPTGTGPDPAGKKYLAGSQYWVDLVKEEGSGQWKIKMFKTKTVWTHGDPSVMSGH